MPALKSLICIVYHKMLFENLFVSRLYSLQIKYVAPYVTRLLLFCMASCELMTVDLTSRWKPHNITVAMFRENVTENIM